MTASPRLRNPDGIARQAFSVALPVEFSEMNSRGSRRTSSPVRLSLAATLSGDLDGAWWPRTGTMVSELPDLIDAVQPTLGEIIDIKINWSASSNAPTLGPLASALTRPGSSGPRHRLMALTGRNAGTRLLVVPATTPSALAVMVLRQAADRHIPEVDRGTANYEAAERVICLARAESAAWAG